jgi:hypothetical protein
MPRAAWHWGGISSAINDPLGTPGSTPLHLYLLLVRGSAGGDYYFPITCGTLRDEILGLRPLHRYQFAYQPGKSTETELHHVITHIEEAVEKSEVTLGAFLDIEEAFDSTSFDIITKAAKWHGLGDTICR